MSVKIIKKTLNNDYFQFNAFAFMPSHDQDAPPVRNEWAIFTHGYTASKSDCLSWAQRLSEAGIPVCLFDLPGHHLGSLNNVNSFDEFKNHSVECFIDAYKFLQKLEAPKCNRVILGGHSLGALLSIKASNLDYFRDLNPLAIGIGLGISQHKTQHLFETSFYQKTLNIRRQLVDESIDSDFVFPWINEEKNNISISGVRIHLITGQDDVVVGTGGMEALAERLKNDNNVTTFEPKKLPHHEPGLASSQIISFLKKELPL
jgi:pimeloyl-ACP methyl ester carboxylesterase